MRAKCKMADVVSDISGGSEQVVVLVNKHSLELLHNGSAGSAVFQQYLRENVLGIDADENIKDLFDEQFDGCSCLNSVSPSKSQSSSTQSTNTQSSNTQSFNAQSYSSQSSDCQSTIFEQADIECSDVDCPCVSRFGSSYDQHGRLISYDPLSPIMRPIFECNCMCSCSSAQCTNRVVQCGVRVRLEIYATRCYAKGLGVRALERIPARSFVCEYTGEIIGEREGERRLREREERGESNYILVVRELLQSVVDSETDTSASESIKISSGKEVSNSNSHSTYPISDQNSAHSCLIPRNSNSDGALKTTSNSNKGVLSQSVYEITCQKIQSNIQNLKENSCKMNGINENVDCTASVCTHNNNLRSVSCDLSEKSLKYDASITKNYIRTCNHGDTSNASQSSSNGTSSNTSHCTSSTNACRILSTDDTSMQNFVKTNLNEANSNENMHDRTILTCVEMNSGGAIPPVDVSATSNRSPVMLTYIDAKHFGNVARFINHSCAPNLFMVPVHIDNLIPCAALFALRDIEFGEELSYDYANGSEWEEPAGEVGGVNVEWEEPAGEVGRVNIEWEEPAGEVGGASVKLEDSASKVGGASVKWEESAGEMGGASVEKLRRVCLCGADNCRKYLPVGFLQ